MKGLSALVPFAVSPGSGLQCGPQEIDCNHVDDGCVNKRNVGDGLAHCLRDGFDETNEAKFLFMENAQPDGIYDK